MTVYVDTSAFVAMLDRADWNHVAAAATWSDLIERHEQVVCNNYVLVETMALVQSRLGIRAARAFHAEMVPALEVEWLAEADHAAAADAVLAARRRHLSLVDCASFGSMRRLGIGTAFAFDRHFVEQGFVCLPS